MEIRGGQCFHVLIAPQDQSLVYITFLFQMNTGYNNTIYLSSTKLNNGSVWIRFCNFEKCIHRKKIARHCSIGLKKVFWSESMCLFRRKIHICNLIDDNV